MTAARRPLQVRDSVTPRDIDEQSPAKAKASPFRDGAHALAKRRAAVDAVNGKFPTGEDGLRGARRGPPPAIATCRLAAGRMFREPAHAPTRTLLDSAAGAAGPQSARTTICATAPLHRLVVWRSARLPNLALATPPSGSGDNIPGGPGLPGPIRERSAARARPPRVGSPRGALAAGRARARVSSAAGRLVSAALGGAGLRNLALSSVPAFSGFAMSSGLLLPLSRHSSTIPPIP